MLRVSQDFNQILISTPSLWRVVELEKGTWDRILQVINLFACRSKNTLEIIKTPETIDEDTSDQFLSLISKSASTLRRVEIGCQSFQSDYYSSCADQNRRYDSISNFLMTLPKIERLNLTQVNFFDMTRSNVPEAEAQIPGILTVFSVDRFSPAHPWSEEQSERFSSLQFLGLGHCDTIQGLKFVQSILQACSQSLITLSLKCWLSWDLGGPLELPSLKRLILDPFTHCSRLSSDPFKNVEHVEGSPEVLSPFRFKKLRSINFIIVCRSDIENVTYSNLVNLRAMASVTQDSASTLGQIRLNSCRETEYFFSSFYSVDSFLRLLKVDPFSNLCPLLSRLFIGENQVYDEILLAQVMASRNLAAKESKVGNGDYQNCSELILHFETPTQIEKFKDAERQVLSRCSERIKNMAGVSQVENWDGL